MGAENSQGMRAARSRCRVFPKYYDTVQKACPQAFPDGLPRGKKQFSSHSGRSGTYLSSSARANNTRHHRPQWRRQVNPSANYFRHSRAVISSTIISIPAAAWQPLLGAGQRLQSRIHGPRKRAAQCRRDPGHRARKKSTKDSDSIAAFADIGDFIDQPVKTIPAA